MGFRSVNEISRFSFRDCVISRFEVTETGLRLVLSALIVEPDNSQNTNYTRSYAGDTTLLLRDGRIEKGIKEGFRYYNADDVLQSETPDEELDPEAVRALLPSFAGAYLYDMQPVPGNADTQKQVYVMGIEMPDDPDWPAGVTDSWQIRVSFTEAVFTWDQYLNRVGN